MYIIIEFLKYTNFFNIYNSIEELKEEINCCKKDKVDYRIFEIKKEIKNV